MCAFNPGLAAKLAKAAAAPKKPREGGGKFAPRQRKAYAPGVETKYVKDGFFTWQTTNSKGNKINTDTPQLRGIIVGQSFEWKDLSESEKGAGDWTVKCATTSHTEDVDGVIVIGNGRWELPYFDHNEVLENYNPIGMKLRDAREDEVDAEGKPVTGQVPMSCAECIEAGLRTCKDQGKIFYVAFEKVDKETEEWVALAKPILMGLRASRGDYDYLRKFEIKLIEEHKKMPHEVVVELGFTQPDKWGNHKLTYTPDLDEKGWSDIATGMYEAELEEFNAAIEAYKAEKAAERAAAKGEKAEDEDKPATATKVTTVAKAQPKAAGKGAVVDINSKAKPATVGSVKKTAPAPVEPDEDDEAEYDENEDGTPF